VNEVEATRQQQADILLRIEDLDVLYGGVQALHGVSLSVREGEVVSVIGANGAGKTSLLSAIVGVVPAQVSVLNYAGRNIAGRAPESLVRDGITLVPEHRELFSDLTVQDNLRLGAFHRRRKGDRVEDDLAQVYSIFPRLAERKRQRAGTMSGGEQQMLAMGRALMAKPRLLLLDEPSLGLAPLIVQEIFRVLEQLRAEGTTVLLIEQNARAALKLADYGYVLETGEVILGAPAAELADDERIQQAYLGMAKA